MNNLTYQGNTFLLDGKPFVILSGAIHYFRVPREYWHDRLLKLRECGFNTVETYTCWNLHEPKEGQFDFSGMLDLGAFVDEAAAVGLHVIVRPGPYICAEWDLGGLPSWLLTYPKLRLRCADPLYLEKVKPYYDQLFRILRPRLVSNGGPIFMMQVENEYGSYGDDKEYLAAVRDLYRENGIDCLLYTSDGACNRMLSGGTLPDLLCVANFGSKPEYSLTFLDNYRPGQPAMCGEFWCGWFDHWREAHHVRPVKEITDCFTYFLDHKASINYYMFHGGTNFGFTNGANYEYRADGTESYEPTVTSYDYNAPLSEAGDRTPLYYALRDMIASYGYPVPALTAAETKKAAYGKVAMTESAAFFDALPAIGKPIHSPAPLSMEDCGQDFGYILYSTTLTGPLDPIDLVVDDLADRARVYLDGAYVGTLERTQNSTPIRFPAVAKGETLRVDLLVENMGRVNYGPALLDRKGVKAVRFFYTHHFGWENTPLPMTDLSAVPFHDVREADGRGAAFYRARFNVRGTPADTFLALPGFHKGFAVLNGHNLGRYWNDVPPQKTLFVPAPWLNEGENELIVFESDNCDAPSVEFRDTPELG